MEQNLIVKGRLQDEVLTKLHDDVYRNDHHINFRRWFYNNYRRCDLSFIASTFFGMSG